MKPTRPQVSGRIRVKLPVLVATVIAVVASLLTPTPAHAAGTVAPQLVVNRDFPDPDLVQDGKTWHAYSTSSSAGRVPHATAPSANGPWTVQGDALGSLPAWARPSHGLWAPDVSKRNDGTWLMYFTARNDANGRMCLGAAVSTSPNGPFKPTSEKTPLVCDPAEGGAIDPASFVDADGKRYLLYKNDGNAVGKPAILWLQEVAANGYTFIGGRTELLRNNASSDAGVIEAPTLIKRPSGYVLFFSAGVYSQGSYHTSYATSPTLRGTYTRAYRPLLTTESVDGAVNGPGGQDVIGNKIFFHGHLPSGGRGMYVADLSWPGDRPVVRGSRVRYEAERGRLNDAVVRKTSSASQGAVVAKIDNPTSWFEVTVEAPVAGTYTAHISYAAGYGAASHTLTVNGGAAQPVEYPASQWETWKPKSVNVTLKKGTNTLRLTKRNGFAEIDQIEVA